MPNALVHYTFAKENVLDPSSSFLDATYVGAQGPDPFFFYGVLPLRNRPHKKETQSLGGVTQHMEMPIPYAAMIEYAKKSPDKDILFSYIDGLFMHYSVDRCCHPYIFYNTGFTDRPTDSKQVQDYYNFSHMSLEVILDVIISKREGTFQPIANVIKIDKKELKAISKMWYMVNKDVQKVNFINEKSFYRSLIDYQGTEVIAHDPLGLKKPLFKAIFGRYSFPYGLVMPRNLKRFDGIDFLNEAHKEWLMPAGEKKKESFDNLLSEAKTIYEILHHLLKEAYEGKEYQNELNVIASHINHEGIVEGSPKIYWKLIWPESYIKDIIEH
jgi:hypothetical protein